MTRDCWKSSPPSRILDRPLGASVRARNSHRPSGRSTTRGLDNEVDAMKATDLIDNDSLRDDLPRLPAG